jgi:hypothetical protein
MGRYSGSQVFLNIAYCLFIFLVTESRPVLAGGFLKLIACVAMACLLAFVVVHSANIYKIAIARLHALPRSLFPMVVARRWSDGLQKIVVTGEPSLSPLFQRPPPFLV